jgi:hypothetical protein
MSESSTLILRSSPWGAIFAFGLGCVLVTMMVLLATLAADAFTRWFGIVGASLLALGTIACVAVSRLELQLSPAGFIEKSAFVTYRWRWNEIQRIWVFEFTPRVSRVAYELAAEVRAPKLWQTRECTLLSNYGHSAPALAELLNQWRERYAASNFDFEHPLDSRNDAD